MRKKIAILGSTGSIGRNTLDVIGHIPDRFEVVGLSAKENISLLKEQIERWHPRIAAVENKEKYNRLRSSISTETKICHGEEGILEVALAKEVELLLCAITGSASLVPTMTAIEAGKRIALASKEAVVMAGELMMAKVKKKRTMLIPVDSEPNAIFQCLEGKEKKYVRRIIITASGGPFRELTKQKMSKVTPQQALSHPAWRMGKKISIDSATMINKGLEVIEAHSLFQIPAGKIEVTVHPDAKIHGMVEFIDGNIFAVICATDMRIPIQHAITYPERVATPLEPLNLSDISPLRFLPPDIARFPGLKLGYKAAEDGGTMPAVLNAANEVAVDAFLHGRIGFLDISEICSELMNGHKTKKDPELREIIETDRSVREKTRSLIKKLSDKKKRMSKRVSVPI